MHEAVSPMHVSCRGSQEDNPDRRRSGSVEEINSNDQAGVMVGPFGIVAISTSVDDRKDVRCRMPAGDDEGRLRP